MEKQSNFRFYLTEPKHFPFSQNQFQFLKVKCAQVLFSILKQLSQKPRKDSITSKGRNTYVKLPAMCPNDIMKTNVLPLGYQCAIQHCQLKHVRHQHYKSLVYLMRIGFFSMVVSVHFTKSALTLSP